MNQPVKTYRRLNKLWYNGILIGRYYSNPAVSKYEYLALLKKYWALTLPESITIAQTANSRGVKVVLVLTLDANETPRFLSSIYQHNILLEVAKHSQDDIKTAVLAGDGNYGSLVDYEYAAIAYSYNQYVNGEWYHAEAVLAEFLRIIGFKEKGLWWLMLLEPCYHCLTDMVDTKAEVIAYYNDHKIKWNTPQYLELKQALQESKIVKYVKEVLVP